MHRRRVTASGSSECRSWAQNRHRAPRIRAPKADA